MKIVSFNAVGDRGGAALVARQLARGYARQGHDGAMVVHREGDGAEVVELSQETGGGCAAGWRRAVLRGAERLEKAGDRVRGAWRMGRALRWAGEPGRQRDLWRGIEDFRGAEAATRRLIDAYAADADVVHLHNLHGGSFDLRLLPELSRRVPTVITMHDAWLLGGHCAHSFGCDRWKTGCGDCPDLSIFPAVKRDATALNWRRKRDIFAQSRLHIATPCRWLMRRVQESILMASGGESGGGGLVDARVIPNGVDLAVFHPGDMDAARAALRLPSRGEAQVLLFAADGIRRSMWKDYATLREAVARIARRAARPIVFVALGEAGDERIDGVDVRFVGYETNPRVVASYYRAADVYLHAAKADTFPNVVLEALACGAPVVATDVGGIGEQVRAGKTGELTAAGDAGAMSDAVVRLLGDEAMRRGMGECAAEDAAGRFSLDAQVRAYVGWFEQIVARGAAGNEERRAA